MKFPFKKIRIGCFDYTVKEEDHDFLETAEAKGQCSFNERILRWAKMNNESNQLETMLHEIVHADFDFFDVKLHSREDDEKECVCFDMETMVDTVAKAEFNRIRQNIPFYKWLIKQVEKLNK